MIKIILCLLLITLSSSAQASEVLFFDDFKGVERIMPDGEKKLYPDHTKWAFTFWPGTVWPDSFGNGTNYLDSNGECQLYITPWTAKINNKPLPTHLRYDPFSIKQDGLHITADLLSPAAMDAYNVSENRKFGSGIIISRDSFKYGTIEMVAKLPSARGSWPAFWLLAKDKKWPPEIDIFEAMPWGSHKNQIRPAMGTEDKTESFGEWIDVGTDITKDFHTYGLDWNEKYLSFSFDGKELVRKPTPELMKKEMYILINLAVGGYWVFNELGVQPIDGKDMGRLLEGTEIIKSDYPATMIIKSVKVTRSLH